jgi:hypothetical protein
MIADTGTTYIVGPTSIMDSIAATIGAVSWFGRYTVKLFIIVDCYF